MNIKLLIQGLALTTVLVSSHLASAVSFDLCTGVTTKTMPDGNIITMWGYGLEATPTPDPSCGSATVPGPQLTVPDGDNVLTINLRNTLEVPTSIMIPGLSASTYLAPTFFTDAQGRLRARAMTQEAAPLIGTQIYNFTATPGTYLYQSGSHPAVQVQMGLYGAVINDTVLGEAYPSVTYDNEIILLYSEVDPALHAAVINGTYGDTNILNNPFLSTINYQPKYFLVNGAPYTTSTPDIVAGTTGQTTLLRFLNAGLESHIPVLQGGYVDVVAEYGSPYPYQRKQFSVLLAAGQSKDALFTTDTVGKYALYDRRLRLTNNTQTQGGLMSFLNVTADAGTPIAVPDPSGTTDEDTVNTAIDLAGNDTDDVSINLDSIYIPFQPANGTVVANNNGTGTVTYTPNANFNGTDTFSYVINDNLGNTSNPADVTITVNSVNDAPIAVNDIYNVFAGNTLSIPATGGVLNNDSDIDLDTLTVQLLTNVTAGSLTLNPDGSFTYIAPNNGTTVDTFTYIVLDGSPNFSSATVTINIEALSAATLISPNSTSTLNSPTYTWNQVTGATQYYLWVNDSTGNVITEFYTPVQAGCNGTTCSVTHATALVNGSAIWWIQASNTSGNGPWSTAMYFTVGTAPNTPILLSPNGSGTPNLPSYTWNEVVGATQYYLWVDDSTGTKIQELFTPAQASCNGTTCSVTPIAPSNTLADGVATWWIQASNTIGNSPWSSAQSFTVGTPPSVAPILVSPNGGTTTSSPSYIWNDVANATHYYLWVNDFTGTAAIQITYLATTICNGGTCSVNNAPPLAVGNAMWWVQASNVSGNSPWSLGETFIVQP